MLKPPPGTVKPDRLNDMTWQTFDRTVGKNLSFTRNNSWIWRSLTHPSVIRRTDDTLMRMRKALETAIRSKEIPDENEAHEQRALLHCRQEQVRTVLTLLEKVNHARDKAAVYREAIQTHKEEGQAADIIPERHDIELWSVLPDPDEENGPPDVEHRDAQQHTG